MKNDAKFEEELTCHFKIDIFTSKLFCFCLIISYKKTMAFTKNSGPRLYEKRKVCYKKTFSIKEC